MEDADFLGAQAADPLDPTPMLIYADWLEESGDLAGARALRGLAAAGIPSIAALAAEAGCPSARGLGGVGPERDGAGAGDGLNTWLSSGDIDNMAAYAYLDEREWDLSVWGEGAGRGDGILNGPAFLPTAGDGYGRENYGGREDDGGGDGSEEGFAPSGRKPAR